MRKEMNRIGVLFLVGRLLSGCTAHQMDTKKVSSVEINNIKPVESVAPDKLNDIEKME